MLDKTGIYFLLGDNKEVLYIGKTTSVFSRIKQHQANWRGLICELKNEYMKTVEQLIFEKRFKDAEFDPNDYNDWAKENEYEAYTLCLAVAKQLQQHSVMQAEGSDVSDGAAVGNSAAGQSGSGGMYCVSSDALVYGKPCKEWCGDENCWRGGSAKGALPR